MHEKPCWGCREEGRVKLRPETEKLKTISRGRKKNAGCMVPRWITIRIREKAREMEIM